MNYFRCTVGGSGKGNTVTVTCAEEFAGLTITLSKTGKTYTKTCPSTAPYVVTFYGVENGTYTVSCTVDGQTYSETVVVQDISCVLNYGFKWQTWVDTASQLDSSDYDSLDEVLADEKALRELFLEHACVDYMAELTCSNEDLETVINNDLCAKWINNSDYALDFLHANEVIADLMDEADKYGYGEWAVMPQVPKMMSNTAPFGTVSASAANSNYEAYKAFDGNDSTGWHTSSAIPSGEEANYVQYDFGTQKKIKEVLIKIQGSSSTAYNYTSILKVSSDGTTFTEIERYTTDLIAMGGTIVSRKIQVNQECRYIRVYSIRQESGYTNVSAIVMEIQAYAWAPKGNVPVMTANNAPYGEASASSTYNTARSPWVAFSDKIIGDGWTTSVNVSSPWLRYKFTNPINAKKARVEVWKSRISSAAKFKIQGSNDGSTFVDVSDEVTIAPYASATMGERIDVDISTENYYLYYQIKFSTVVITGDNNFYAFKLQFYGRELKVSVPTMTANTAPYGEVIANSTASGYYAYAPFNSTNSGTWFDGDTSSQNTHYLGYVFTSPIKGTKVYIKITGISSHATTWDMKVQGSNDRTAWEDVSEVKTSASITTGSYSTDFDIDTENEVYQLYRVTFTNGLAPEYYQSPKVNELQFYGLDYSEKEFEAGTTKKWLYDHGVELVELDISKGSSTTSSASLDDSGQIYIEPLSGTNNNASNFITIGATLDISPYVLNRAIVGNKAISTTMNAFIGVWTSKPTNGGSYVNDNLQGRTDITIPISSPNGIALDISSFNGTEWISFNNVYGNSKSGSIKEWWLE